MKTKPRHGDVMCAHCQYRWIRVYEAKANGPSFPAEAISLDILLVWRAEQLDEIPHGWGLHDRRCTEYLGMDLMSALHNCS